MSGQSTNMADNVPIGSRWKMYGLTSSAGQKLNGKKCTMISTITDGDRFVVQVDGTKQKVKVRLNNIERLKDKNARSKSQRIRDIHGRAVSIVKQIINTSPGSARMDLAQKHVVQRSTGWFTGARGPASFDKRVMHKGWHGALDWDDMQYDSEGTTWSPRLKHLYTLRKLSIKEFPGKEHNGHVAKRWFPNPGTGEISTLIELLVVSLLDSCELFARSSKTPSVPLIQPCEVELAVHILDELACSDFDVNEKVRDCITNYCSTASRRHILSTLCTGLVPHISPSLHNIYWNVGTKIELLRVPQPGRMFGCAMVPSASLHNIAINIVGHCAMQSASRQIQLGRMTNLIGTLCYSLRVGAKNEETLHVDGDVDSGKNYVSISNSIGATIALTNMCGRSSGQTDYNLRLALHPNCGILESVISACCRWLTRFDQAPHNRMAFDNGLVERQSISFATPLAWFMRLIGSFMMALGIHKFNLFNFEPNVRAKTFWSQVLAHEDCPNTVEKIEHVLLRAIAIGLTDGANCQFKGSLLEKGNVSHSSPVAFAWFMEFLAYLHSGFPVGFRSRPTISEPSKYGLSNDLDVVDDSVLSSWFNNVVVDPSVDEKKRKTLCDALSDLMKHLNSGRRHDMTLSEVVVFSEYMKINKKVIDRVSGTNHSGLDLKKNQHQYSKKERGPCWMCGCSTEKKCTCGEIRFCSVGCQKNAWPNHKAECKRIRKEKKDGGKKKKEKKKKKKKKEEVL